MVLLMVSGCASIPTSSRIEVIEDVNQVDAQDSVRVIVRPPTAAMNAVQVVEGFLAANASTTDNFRVARQYFTTRGAATWKPDEIAVVEPSSINVVPVSEDLMSVSMVQIGKRDVSGRLTLFSTPVALNQELRLIITDVGLRITQAPNLAWMSYTDLDRNFQSNAVYFLTADYERLVPDFVWLPTLSSGNPTRVVQTLLAGPGGTLASAAVSAFPNDSKLAVGAVTVQQGTANVALNEVALTASESQRRALLAQLVYSLTELPGISEIRVTAANQPLFNNGILEFSRADVARFNPDFRTVKDPFFRVSENLLARGLEIQEAVVNPPFFAQSVAVSRSGATLAWVSNGIVRRSPLTNPTAAEIVGSGITTIDFDAENRLWMVGVDGSIQIKSGSRATQQVIGVSASEKVLSLAVSPDGARVALIVESPRGRQLRIHSVSVFATTVSLGLAQRVEQFFSSVSDVDWLSSLQLAVVGQTSIEEPQVYLYSMLGGVPRALQGPTDIAQIVAAPNQPVVVITSRGEVWVYRITQWVASGQASAIAYAG
jgi:hypothetical protein